MAKAKRFMAGGLSDLLGQGPQTQAAPAAEQQPISVNVAAPQASSADSMAASYAPQAQDVQNQQANGSLYGAATQARLKKGGKVKVKKMASGGAVKARGCGCAQRGLTKGKMR